MNEYVHEDGDGDVLRIDTLTKGSAILSVESEYAAYVGVPADKVDEVYHALRKAAGMPEVWVVEKTDREILDEYSIDTARMIEQGDVASLRSFVEHLLCCEEAARANVRVLPTAVDSVVKLFDSVYVRSERGWGKARSTITYPDSDFKGTPFTILYDAGAGNE